MSFRSIVANQARSLAIMRSQRKLRKYPALIEVIRSASGSMSAAVDLPDSVALGGIGHLISQAYINEATRLVDDNSIGDNEKERIVVGEGNHRVLVCKG